jgi:dienelactone hydrolase
MHAPLQLRDLGWAAWPAGVPVQTHFAKADPLRSAATIDSLRKRVGASGGEFQEFTYPEGGHLFSDSGLAAYSASSADAMFGNVVQFLDWLGSRGGHSPDRAGRSGLM